MTRVPTDRLVPAAYQYTVSVAARFADIDILRHVNNIAIAELFEEARASFLRTVFGSDSWFRGGNRVLTARSAIDYLREVAYPGEYQIGVAVARLGNSSATIVSALFDESRCAAVSENVLVHVAAIGPSAWSAEDRAALSSSRWVLAPATDA